MAAKAQRSQAATRLSELPPPVESPAVPASRGLPAMEHADGKSIDKPQVIPLPRCRHCGSDRVKVAKTGGVYMNGRRYVQRMYRCCDPDNPKCKGAGRAVGGDGDLTPVFIGPFGVMVSGKVTADAAKVNFEEHRPKRTKPRSDIRFASGV